MLSGKPSWQEQAIYITGKTPFLRKRTCTRRSIWSNHEKADRPISSQHHRCYQEANLELFHEQMQKCRSIPCAADSRQHARIADIPKIQRKYSVIDQSQQEEQHQPFCRLQHQPAAHHTASRRRRAGKRKRYPGEKYEKRENCVVMPESFPRHMFHLKSEPTIMRTAHQCRQFIKHAAHSHEKHHIKASKRIQ